MFTPKIQVQDLGSVSSSEFRFYVYKMLKGGTSLVVQWLRLHFPMKGVQVWSSVWELRSHITSWPKDQDVKQKPCCNTVNRLLKWSTLKKKILKLMLKRKNETYNSRLHQKQCEKSIWNSCRHWTEEIVCETQIFWVLLEFGWSARPRRLHLSQSQRLSPFTGHLSEMSHLQGNREQSERVCPWGSDLSCIASRLWSWTGHIHVSTSVSTSVDWVQR